MRTLQIILLAVTMLALAGCSHDSFDFKAGKFSRWSFLQDISISSVEYNPETSKFKVEGVDSDAKFDDFVKAWGAIR